MDLSLSPLHPPPTPGFGRVLALKGLLESRLSCLLPSPMALLGRNHQPSILGLPLDLSPSLIPCPVPLPGLQCSRPAEDRDGLTPLSLQD